MIGVEDHHLRGAPGLAAALDDAGKRIEALHEAERTGSAAAARQDGIFFAERRKIGPGAGSPLEQHAFGFGEIENRLQRVGDGVDEAGRALRMVLARLQFLTTCPASS